MAQTSFYPNILWTKRFLDKFSFTKFSRAIFYLPTFFVPKNFLGLFRILIFLTFIYLNTSLAAKGALAHRLTATPHGLQHFTSCFYENFKNPKVLPGGPKMANGVWKGVNPKVFGRSHQLSLNKFFNPSAPSMRKVDDGEKKKKKNNNGVFSGHYVIASSLPPERLRPNDDRWNAARSCQLFIQVRGSGLNY